MFRSLVGAAILLAAFGPVSIGQERRVPLLVDTDFGSYLDDALALALAVASPDVELRGVTTSGGDAENRAWMVCRFLDAAERREVPVAWGRPPQSEGKVEAMYQYRYHPALLYGRMGKPIEDDACELMYRELKARPGEITLVVLGPQTNVARLLEKHPDAGPWIKRLVIMGGALGIPYGKRPLEPEWNIKSDVVAAKAVLAAGLPVTYVPLDVRSAHSLGYPQKHRLYAAQTLLTQQMLLLDQLDENDRPLLDDAVAMAAAIDPERVAASEKAISIDDRGLMQTTEDKPNGRVAAAMTYPQFAAWLVDRLVAFGKRAEPRAARNVVQPVPRGGLPRRVHVFENYESDIERRWWLAGRATPDANSGRVCIRVLTEDFDDKQGDHATLYSAVIFNPVPGPPMGEHTRLAFRYKLAGTDSLRVQMYSLTNGYHRQLTLRGLPQGEWREATVDMTQLRRPDGSGGALAKDERIDDIQFYAAPTATLWIDDVVLYDAAPDDEKRPFPKRFVFTGWFDTGKQGQEWPGDFEIVPHQPPRTWKAAQSLENKATGKPWIRISLRGERPVGQTTSLRFAYHLAGASSIEVILANSRTGKRATKQLTDITADAWSEQHLEFDTQELASADELHFLLPAGAALQVDDVLVYEPG